MDMSKVTAKYNETGVAMFEFLKLLTYGDATYDNVLKFCKEYCKGESSNPYVPLNKYLNTLKIFGIQVKKDKNRYYLLSTPYKIDLTGEDLRAVEIFKAYIKLMPESKAKTHFEQFLKNLELRYSESTQELSNSIRYDDIAGSLFYSTEFGSAQIRQCEKYCENKFKLNITYINKENEEQQLMFCSPIEVKYQKRKICLSVYKQDGCVVDIPLDIIRRIDQLPTLAANNPQPATVIFKIKGRLNKNYRLRDWETLMEVEPNGDLVIVNKNEDFDVLLRRLMRYGRFCTVSSPKTLRTKMKELIEETLSQYNQISP
jgi:hypothetical protein